MQRITIRNLRSSKAAKLRLFDAIVKNGRVYLEVKVSGSRGSEVVPLADIIEQISIAKLEESPGGIAEPT